jgi:tripartite-type tricarboxylate transporter receptor subunit TctC
MRHRPSILSGTIVAVAALALCQTAAAATQDFYQGKTIRIIVGASAGGGFDTYSRTIARHLGRQIAGNPAVLVENMAGAGGLITANHIYKVARPDGLMLGTFVGGLLLGKILGVSGVEFDALKFEYVGMPAKTHPVCTLGKAGGVTTIEQWMAAKAPVKLGGVGHGTETDDIPKVLMATIGLPIQLVSGYKGTADVRLAAESGEIAGGCWSWDSVKVTWAKAIQSGDAVVVLQVTPKPHPDLPNVRLALSLVKTDEARELLHAAAHSPSTIYRPYVLPPGTPKDRVEILRKAFQATLADPEFAAEAKKSRLTIDPVTGDELERTVAGLFNMKPSVLARVKEIIAPK